MTDPATELTRHDEDHGHYTDRPTLHDQLTAALAGKLTEMWKPEVGHSCTGDLPALADDARVLATVAEKVMGDVWEQGRKHGLRQVWKLHNARVKQLEEEIEGMLALEEANGQAFALKCLKVRELEAEVDRLRAYLAYATHFDVCGIEVYPQGDAWMCRGASGIDEHDGPYEALDHARQRAGVSE